MGEYADYTIDDGIAAMFFEDNDEFDEFDTDQSVWPFPYRRRRKRSAIDVFKNYRIPDKLE
jgi:hypothetical protein